MQALEFSAFGEADAVLRLVERDLPSLPPDWLRVRVMAAGLNPSDLVNVRGGFPYTTLPRIPGRDFGGVVELGPAELLGCRVYGSGGDIGFTRDGSHAQFIDLPAGGAALLPAVLSFTQAAAVGVPFCTAWQALEKCRVKADELLLVSGALGAVGSAALQLALARGIRVLALVRSAAQAEQMRADSRLAGIASAEAGDLPAVVATASGGAGLDVVLNGLGAGALAELLPLLRPGGRMAVYSTLYAGREAQLDLLDFYRRRLELHGINTLSLDCVAAAQVLEQLAALFSSGQLAVPAVDHELPLSRSLEAYALLAGSGSGKVVLLPQEAA